MNKLGEPVTPDREAAAAPRLSGEFIRQALIGKAEIPANCPLTVDDRGARMEGVTVEGGLDLSALKFDRPIAFERCTFLGAIILRNAQLGPVSFAGSRAPHIDAQNLTVSGDLDLQGARIESRGTHQFGGIHDGAYSFFGMSMEISGSVLLSKGFQADGPVTVTMSKIGGYLLCVGGRFRHPFSTATSTPWYTAANCALSGLGARIGGDLALSGGFRAEGLVQFIGAQIEGGLILIRAGLTAAQSTSGAVAGGPPDDLSVRLIFQARSGLVLLNARLGSLITANAERFEGLLMLRGATVHTIADDGTLWRDPMTGAPRKGVAIDLDDFQYDSFINSFDSLTDASWQARLQWLKAQPKEHLTDDFHARPFTQCADVLRTMGDTHGARMILYERERLRLKAKNVRLWEKAGGYVSGALAGHGYKNHRALYWAIGVWLMGALIFGVADRIGAMRPADPHVLAEAHYQETLRPPTDYEPLKPALFSADILIPIVDLGQQEFWIPRDAGERKADSAAAFPRLHRTLVPAVSWLFSGWLAKAYYYFEI